MDILLQPLLHLITIGLVLQLPHQAQADEMMKIHYRETNSVSAKLGEKGLSAVEKPQRVDQILRPDFPSANQSENDDDILWDLPWSKNKLGLAPIDILMKNVRYKTQKESFELRMPHRKIKEYDASEAILHPQIPPEVLRIPGADGQIQEMREWFKAWQNQDASIRNYKHFFKPVLCYLEGNWLNPTSEKWSQKKDHLGTVNSRLRIYSRRWRRPIHLILSQKKMMFFGYKPQRPRWDYKVRCVPLCGDLPLIRLKAKHGSSRNPLKVQTFQSKNTRYELCRSSFKDSIAEKEIFLNECMTNMPGKDNFPASFPLSNASIKLPWNVLENLASLNLGFYYKFTLRTNKNIRTQLPSHMHSKLYGDENPYRAENSRAEVAGIEYLNVDVKTKKLSVLTQKWSYAIPFEIVYLTPLSRWNPYGIKYSPKGTVGDDGIVNPLKGVNDTIYFKTPVSFFDTHDLKTNGEERIKIVKDSNGMIQEVVGSGIRTITPSIPGLGRVRLRYPLLTQVDKTNDNIITII